MVVRVILMRRPLIILPSRDRSRVETLALRRELPVYRRTSQFTPPPLLVVGVCRLSSLLMNPTLTMVRITTCRLCYRGAPRQGTRVAPTLAHSGAKASRVRE